jgi:hypothetical protein
MPEEQAQMSLSLGEQRVRTTFNPSTKNLVDEIKQKSADLINLIETIPGELTHAEPEQIRLMRLAQTAYEEGAMWAVKAATA